MTVNTQSERSIPLPKAGADAGPKRPWALSELPPFPPIANRLLGLLAKDDVGLRGISDLITKDAAFAAEVLRIANSSMFGIKTEISSILQGVAFLGTERVKSLAFTVAMRTYLKKALASDVLKRCWRHNLACAVIAEDLAGRLYLDPAQGYTAGLMHDIGRMALIAAYPKQCVHLFEVAQENEFDLLNCERDLFDLDHCEAGAWLVKEWGLPNEFEAYTLHHHDPCGANFSGLLGVTQASCALATALGFSAVNSSPHLCSDEVLAAMPEWERGRISPTMPDLAFRVAAKVNAMDH